MRARYFCARARENADLLWMHQAMTTPRQSTQSSPSPVAPAAPPAPVEVAIDPFLGRRAYLIGIGGCGMSGLARMLAERGAIVRGSDNAQTDVTDSLARRGIEVSFDQQAALIPEDADLVIASAAIRPDHPEMAAALERGIETLTYAEALGRCMIGRTGVALAGTHGKSTTSAMLGVALAHAGIDPTVIVGAVCTQLARPGDVASGFRMGRPAIPAGPRQGEPGVLICEACEFNRSFHHLRPTIAAITSVEADHLDIYGSLDAVIESFAQFARNIPSGAEGGRLLIAHQNAHRREVTAGLTCDVETIGFAPGADWQITLDKKTQRVTVENHGRTALSFTSPLPGEHMACNAAFAGVLALWLGADSEKVCEGLSSFKGVDRRMQFLGEKRLPMGRSPRVGVISTNATDTPTIPRAPGVRVYDDYGHHPTEIETTLRALREFEKPEERAQFGGGRLICVFQPHQHSRTRFLMEEFAQAFTHADVVIVPQIYFVRDSEIEKTKVSSADLVDRLRQRGVMAMHLYPFEAIVEQLQIICRPGDLLVVMGAGPVWKVARGFLDAGTGAS